HIVSSVTLKPRPKGAVLCILYAQSLGSFAESETAEATNDKVLAKLCNVLFEVFADRYVWILDVRLIKQAALCEVLLELAFDDLLCHFSRLALKCITLEELSFLGILSFSRNFIA